MRGNRGALGFAAFVLVVLTACQPAPIEPWPLSSFRVDSFSLQVEAASASLTLAAGYPCPTFIGTALMNGQPLVQTVEGSFHRQLVVDWVCNVPTWEVPLPLPDEPSTTFEVFDDSGRVVLALSNLGAPRTLALAPGQSSTVRWGERLLLEWSPASDSASPSVLLHREGTNPILLGGPPGEPKQAGGRITLLLPPAPDDGPTQGPAELEVTATFVHPGVQRCEPYPEVCRASISKNRTGRDVNEGALVEVTIPLTIE